MIKAHIKNLDAIGGGEYEVVVTEKGGGDASHGGMVRIYIPRSTNIEIKDADEGVVLTFPGDMEIETIVNISQDIIKLYNMVNKNVSS